MYEEKSNSGFHNLSEIDGYKKIIDSNSADLSCLKFSQITYLIFTARSFKLIYICS